MTIDYAEARFIAEEVAAPLIAELHTQQDEIRTLTERLADVEHKAEELRRYKMDDPNAY